MPNKTFYNNLFFMTFMLFMVKTRFTPYDSLVLLGSAMTELGEKGVVRGRGFLIGRLLF